MTTHTKKEPSPATQTVADVNASAAQAQQTADTTSASEPQPVLTPLEVAQKEIAQLTDTLKRVQADFENYQKRQEQQSRQMVAFSSQRIISKLIPIFDMFDISLKHKENVSEFITGVEMIHGSFLQLLTDERVTIPELVGKKFDPRLAKAVGTKVVPKTEAGIVLEVATPCYMLEDRVIKHANVIVSATASSDAGAGEQK